MSLLRSFATVGGYTGLSRILGFARDVLIAAHLGAGPVADAFVVAFRLPNLFRRLFAEGAFNAAFVPLFARRLEQEGRDQAKRFAEDTLALLLFALLVLTVVALIAMPWLMYLLAPGFSTDPEKFAIAVELSRITFPYLLFMALVALFGGILNALYRFTAAAAAPIVLNIFFLLALVFVVPRTALPGHVLAWTVAFAGIGQFLLLVIAGARAGMALRLPRPRLTPGVRRFLKLMVPGIISGGALQINIMVGTIIASLQDGANAWLYYADRIYQLPLGLIGIAFGVVLLPDLSRKLRSGAESAAMWSFNRVLELALLLTLPATVALAVVPEPIVSVLFERGAFGAEAARQTAFALAAFATGLPAYVLVKILQPGFYAREDTVTPLRYTAVSIGANLALSLALFWPLGHVGIALATALAAWLNTALLLATLLKRGFLAVDARFSRRLWRIASASVLMGGGLWAMNRWLASWFAGSALERGSALAILVASGIAVYFVLAFALRAVDTGEIAQLWRRRPGSRTSS